VLAGTTGIGPPSTQQFKVHIHEGS
jgi:hypothetical protein